MVESASLLTRYPLTGIMGSNPIVSARTNISVRKGAFCLLGGDEEANCLASVWDSKRFSLIFDDVLIGKNGKPVLLRYGENPIVSANLMRHGGK